MHEPIEPSEAEVLIQNYVSGQLTPAEAARLLECIKAEPSLGAALLGQMEIDIMLRELNGVGGWNSQLASFADPLPDTEPLATSLTQSTETAGYGRPSWSGVQPWMAGLAAALALVAGYWFWPEHDNLPRLGRSSPGVEVQRGEERLPATGKLRLQAGDIVETGPGQSAVVEFAREGTRLELKEATRLGLLDWEKGKHIALHHGKLEVAVARQPAGQPMELATPQAEASVRGTKFSLSSQSEATWLKVTKGAVDLRSKALGLSQPVMAGQFAVAASNIQFGARPIDRDELGIGVSVEPDVVDRGGDGEWEIGLNFVRQARVSPYPDHKPPAPYTQNPLSWLTRPISMGGNLEVSLRVQLDAVSPGSGPLAYAEFGFTLILDRRHLGFICRRETTGDGEVKLHSFYFRQAPRIAGDETSGKTRAPFSSQPGRIYELRVTLTQLLPDQIRFRGKVWPAGTREPRDWQLDAVCGAPLAKPKLSLDTRRCACTFTNVQVRLIE